MKWSIAATAAAQIGAHLAGLLPESRAAVRAAMDIYLTRPCLTIPRPCKNVPNGPIRMVELGGDSVDAAFRHQYTDKVDSRGATTVLAGAPNAMNNIGQPTNIAPKQEAINGLSPNFHWTGPPDSLTILRLIESPDWYVLP